MCQISYILNNISTGINHTQYQTTIVALQFIFLQVNLIVYLVL